MQIKHDNIGSLNANSFKGFLKSSRFANHFKVHVGVQHSGNNRTDYVLVVCNENFNRHLSPEVRFSHQRFEAVSHNVAAIKY
jgi:hypothetical protein